MQLPAMAGEGDGGKFVRYNNFRIVLINAAASRTAAAGTTSLTPRKYLTARKYLKHAAL